jgi:hypothetical protein
MAVKSNAFGGLQLSGEDAQKFRNQTRSRTRNAAARAAAMSGIQAARRMLELDKVAEGGN